jgi:CheY-like chemotaxis protein
MGDGPTAGWQNAGLVGYTVSDAGKAIYAVFDAVFMGGPGRFAGACSPGFPGVISGSTPASQFPERIYDGHMMFFRKKKAVRPEFVPVVLPDPIDPNAPRKKILIVEDDAVVAKALSMTLNARGYEALVAVDSAEAIKLVREQAPDMMLVDVGLRPDIAMGGANLADGFQVTQWLSQTNARKIPSIIISGSNKPAYKRQAAAIGAEAFMAKPLDNAMLVESIESALANPAPVVESGEALSRLKMAVGSGAE